MAKWSSLGSLLPKMDEDGLSSAPVRWRTQSRTGSYSCTGDGAGGRRARCANETRCSPARCSGVGRRVHCSRRRRFTERRSGLRKQMARPLSSPADPPGGRRRSRPPERASDACVRSRAAVMPKPAGTRAAPRSASAERRAPEDAPPPPPPPQPLPPLSSYLGLHLGDFALFLAQQQEIRVQVVDQDALDLLARARQVDRRGDQRHEWHRKGLDALALHLPLGRHGVRERLGGKDERLAGRRLEHALVQVDLVADVLALRERACRGVGVGPRRVGSRGLAKCAGPCRVRSRRRSVPGSRVAPPDDAARLACAATLLCGTMCAVARSQTLPCATLRAPSPASMHRRHPPPCATRCAAHPPPPRAPRTSCRAGCTVTFL